MEEYVIDTYNFDANHDMWIESDYNENIGELPFVKDYIDLDKFIDNLKGRN